MLKILLAAIAGLFLLQTLHILGGYRCHARVAAKQLQVQAFYRALDTFQNDTGRFPAEREGLQALRSPTADNSWRGPYLQGQIPTDPWGEAYVYRIGPAGAPFIK